jgi:hypothetical protein
MHSSPHFRNRWHSRRWRSLIGGARRCLGPMPLGLGMLNRRACSIRRGISRIRGIITIGGGSEYTSLRRYLHNAFSRFTIWTVSRPILMAEPRRSRSCCARNKLIDSTACNLRRQAGNDIDSDEKKSEETSHGILKA